MLSFFFAPVVSKKKRVFGCGEAHRYNVGASIARPRASLREGGGFCEAKDGRSKRNEEVIQTELQRVLPQSRSCVTAPSRREPFLYHLRRFFFVSFLLFLLSQKKKQEKPDGKRKKKKGCSRSGLAAARSRHGSDTTLWCHSLPRRRFTTL